MSKIATENYAYQVGGQGSYPSQPNKCCTKSRAGTFGCDILNNHGVTYTNNQLVMMDDLTQKIEKIPFKMRAISGLASINEVSALAVEPRAVTQVQIVTNKETRNLTSVNFDGELNIAPENGQYAVNVYITAPLSYDYYNFQWYYTLGGYMNPSLFGVSQQFSAISWQTFSYSNSYWLGCRNTSGTGTYHNMWATIGVQFRESQYSTDEWKNGSIRIYYNSN